MLLPDTMELRICVPYNSRSTAWASFDGRGRVELKQGDHIKVTASKYPFPTVCADKQSTDWFQSISRTLKWNERERQKSFVMVEEEDVKLRSSRRVSTPPTSLETGQSVLDEKDEIDDEEEEKEDNGDEEEEKFDIDDSANPSLNNSRAPSTTTSAAPSGHNTPAHSTFPSKGDLSMTSITQATSPGSPDLPAANGTSDIDMHEDGYRDNIHSPKSLTHGAKSAIPKDRDIDSMRTPRAHVAHPHIRRHHHHHMQNAAAHVRLAHPQGSTHISLNAGPLPHVPRLSHLRARAHRPSRSADFATGNRAFAVWGQDESDSNTDSEA
jgi:NAD+ kinase